MSLQTPRILPAHLPTFHASSNPRAPHTVRLLGTVSALKGDTATITCGGNGDVSIILKPDSHLQMGKLVEVVGKVVDLEGGQGLGIRVLGTMDWGSPANCDYKMYERVVEATHRVKGIFYDSNE